MKKVKSISQRLPLNKGASLCCQMFCNVRNKRIAGGLNQSRAKDAA